MNQRTDKKVKCDYPRCKRAESRCGVCDWSTLASAPPAATGATGELRGEAQTEIGNLIKAVSPSATGATPRTVKPHRSGGGHFVEPFPMALPTGELPHHTKAVPTPSTDALYRPRQDTNGFTVYAVLSMDTMYKHACGLELRCDDARFASEVLGYYFEYGEKNPASSLGDRVKATLDKYGAPTDDTESKG